MDDLIKQELREVAEAIPNARLVSREGAALLRRWVDLATPSAILSLLDELEGQRAEIEELDELRKRQSDLLSQSAVALRGPEPALTRYSHADIPSRVKTVIAERDKLLADVEALRKDADRYRWLRDKSESLHSFYLSTPIWMTGVRFRQEDVDRSIDTSMTGEVGNG